MKNDSVCFDGFFSLNILYILYVLFELSTKKEFNLNNYFFWKLYVDFLKKKSPYSIMKMFTSDIGLTCD